jgi:carbonic anhydrase
VAGSHPLAAGARSPRRSSAPPQAADGDDIMVRAPVPTALAVALAVACLPAQDAPDAALLALQEGNRRFVAADRPLRRTTEAARVELAQRERPRAIVIACADSRVPPERVFDADLGELFVIRVAGNVVDADVVASVEYAAGRLGAPLCVVLGHEHCDAVQACLEPDESGAERQSLQVDLLLTRISAAVRETPRGPLTGKPLFGRAEAENARFMARECLRQSPLLRRLARDGTFKVVAGRYQLASGEVEWLDPTGADGAAASRQPSAVAVAPPLALARLRAGHRRFLDGERPTADVSVRRRADVVGSQQPQAIVVACADARVSPEHLFDAGLGELFVVRVAGNVLDDQTLASVELAAERLGVSLCVVLGHTRCGAVRAAAERDGELTPGMRALLCRIEPALERARAQGFLGDAAIDRAAALNALGFVTTARAGSEVLRALEAAGRFAMVAAVYDLASGEIVWLDGAEGASAAAGLPAPLAQPAGR